MMERVERVHLFAPLFFALVLAGCEIFDLPDYEYCAEDPERTECCVLEDTRDGARKFKCVVPDTCIRDHEQQTVRSPYTPDRDDGRVCNRREKTVRLDPPQMRYLAKTLAARLEHNLNSYDVQTQASWTLAMSGGSCRAQCDSPSSPYCERIPAVSDSDNSLISSIENARNELAAGRTRTSMGVYMEIFGIQTDPCGRGDVIVDGQLITNEGDACVLKTQLSTFPGVPPLGVTITVPAQVVATYHGSSEDFVLAFNRTTLAPRLMLDDEGLDSEWGGTIRSIHASPADLLVETENGCLALNTGDQV